MKEIESVAYRKALIELIDRRTRTINSVVLGLGIFLSLSAIVLVSNTIRLAIHAKRKLIRTMALVGATSSFIRMPFLLEGTLQGIIGGVLASGILYAFLEYAIPLVSADLQEYIHMEPVFYLLVVGIGMGLGFVGSVVSVLRFIDAG